MDADTTRRIEEARQRAVPLPWRPPFPILIELGPDKVHQALIAEAVAAQMRPCYRVLDGAGLHALAFELRRITNLIDAAGQVARKVA